MPPSNDKKGLSKSSSAASLTNLEKDKGLKFNPADGSVIRPQSTNEIVTYPVQRRRKFQRDNATSHLIYNFV